MSNSFVPILSILVITYNQSRYIKECLLGVFSQKLDWKKVEVIISDDCSNDGTADIVSELAAAHPYVSTRLLRNDINVGVTRNIHKVLSEARGRYIAFVEGDDVWCNDEKCISQIKYLEENPNVVMVCADIDLIDRNGSALNVENKKYVEYMYIKGKAKSIYEFLDVYFENFIFTCTVCFRRSSIDFNILNSHIENLYDSMLWLNICRHGCIKYCPIVFAKYRVHEMGVSASDAVRISWKKIRISASLDLMKIRHIRSPEDFLRYLRTVVSIASTNDVSKIVEIKLIAHVIRCVTVYPFYNLSKVVRYIAHANSK